MIHKEDVVMTVIVVVLVVLSMIFTACVVARAFG